MAIPLSPPVSLSDLATEYGATAPYSLSTFLGESGAPTAFPASLSDWYGLSADDFIPDALDWPNISGTSLAEGANDQVTGISSNIDLSWAITNISTNNAGSATVNAIINGSTFVTIWSLAAGTNTTPTSVANGANISFSSSVSAANPSLASNCAGTVAVRNQSDSNTQLDTFTWTNDAPI